MKKSVLLLFSIFCCSLLKAQSYSINWAKPISTLDTNFKPVTLLYIENGGYDESMLPFVEHVLLGNITAIQLKEEKIELATAFEQSLVKQSLGAQFSYSIRYGYQNKKYCSTIRIYPLKRTAQGVEKLIQYSFQATVESDPEPESRKIINPNASKLTSNARTATFANASVLSSGSWYKVSVANDGIYKLDYNYFVSMGVDVSSIDPRTIKVFGNGGGMLPQSNSSPRIDDLAENAVLFVGESDGVFNSNDYLLFYAQGPHRWNFNTTTQQFTHIQNIYSERVFYFITFGGANGKRVADVPNVGSASHSLSTFHDRLFYENDQYNIINSGREWYGDLFDNNTLTRTYSYNFPNITSNSTVKLTSSVLNRSTTGVNFFTIRINSVNVGTQSMGLVTTGQFDQKGQTGYNTYSINSNSISNPSNLSITYTYSNSSYGSMAHLNFLELNVERDLQFTGNSMPFRNITDRDFTNTEFVIQNVNSGDRIWNVSTPYAVSNQLYSLTSNTASFTAASDTIEEYIIFSGSNFSSPTYVGQVDNQNLHGTNAPNLPDMVIVTAQPFKSEANRLANFKKNFLNMDVLVVTTEEVYNEFSSGAQDITAIRDFMKMLYDRKSGSDSIRYLMLFGDASFDYKNRITDNTNYVPCYEAVQSLRPLESYPSDDYYAFLDDNEGSWRESPTENHLMDIGTGRILVKSAAEAAGAVDKIIHYSQSTSNLGKWRNRILFVADDGDNNTHQLDAEDLANKVDTAYVRYLSNKLYLDANIQIITPGGEKSPAAKEKLDLAVEKGALILNYTGHGGEGGWTQEAILGWNQLESWDNYNNMPFMITATCEFGSYDNPAKPSGAEVALLRSDGGAIGLISSSRVVYQVYNKVLNTQIFNNILKQSANGNYLTLGDVIRNSKNVNITGVYNRNYILLGDPSLTLAYPKQKAVITKIKNALVSSNPDTIKALSVVSIEGEIRDYSNSLISGYAGEIDVTVYDKAVKLSTYGTQSNSMTYSSRSSFIFDGKASISNGKWSINFVVPKDINYEYDFGRISLYAKPSSGILDANGVYTNLIIGGTDTSVSADNAPPKISLFMNDETFADGGLVNKDALFIAKLSDDNGINVASSGIGHEITGELDNTQETIVMNDYYSANVDDYKNGYVRYPMKDLSTGNHVLKFKAWDTHNNSAESQIEFVVANDENSAISHVLNYPNPFSSYTEFHFDHNKAGEQLDVMVQVFTISGKLVKTLQTSDLSSGSHFNGLVWDGKDDFGDKIGKGVYIYKVTIRSPRDGSSAYKYEKLVLLN